MTTELIDDRRFSLVRCCVDTLRGRRSCYLILRLLSDGGPNYLHADDKLIANGSWEAMKAAWKAYAHE